MSPSALLDVRAGWQRFQEPNVRQHEGIFDPASLGFPPGVASLFGGAKYFPHFDFDLFTIGDQIGASTIHSIYSFQPTLTRIFGNHSIRTGYDLRMYREFGSEAAGQAGEYVINPFQGLLSGTGFNGATIARSQLLRPFPQFGNIRTYDDNGTSIYNSAQVKLEKRFTTRFSALAAYTWSRFTERVFKLNPTDTEYENRLSQYDVPHRVSISGIWQLPWGFSVQGIGQFQSGQPISFHDRNIYFNGDLASLKTNYSGDTNQPVFDISGFYFHDAAVRTNGVDDPAKQRADQRIRLANNLRYFPSRVAGLRGQGLNLWDISIVKQLPINGRLRAQLHAEFLNAFNHAVFANPNTDPTSADFGKVTSQNNLPRDIQLAVKLVF